MLEGSTLIVTTLSMILVLLYITGAVLNRTGQPFLPGPKPHPFVGHTFQVPQTKTWKYFEQLYHRYGLCALCLEPSLMVTTFLQDPS
jgi:hypothetical protein